MTYVTFGFDNCHLRVDWHQAAPNEGQVGTMRKTLSQMRADIEAEAVAMTGLTEAEVRDAVKAFELRQNSATRTGRSGSKFSECPGTVYGTHAELMRDNGCCDWCGTEAAGD